MNLRDYFFSNRCSQKTKIFLSFLKGSAIGFLILFLICTLAVIFFRFKYSGKVCPKVYFFSHDLSGMQIEEVEKILTKEESNFFAQKLTLIWKEDPVKNWEIAPVMIDLRFNREEMIREIFFKETVETGINYFWKSYKLLTLPKIINPKYLYDEKKLTEFVSGIANQVDLPAKDALLEFKEGKVTEFKTSEEGRELNQSVLSSNIISSFDQYPFKETILDLPVEKVLPKVVTSQTNLLGIKELLAGGESFFLDSIPTRVYNIILASSKFHGLVIPPGETFSFAKNIGEISAATGYKQAYVIKEKKTILEDGGGVCQVSTTMFRAALNAGLPIVERQPHYYRVPFYEQGGYPPGLDATVYPPSPDLKFTNDTLAYILIQTEVDKDKKRLVFKFYGTNDGRRSVVEKPIIWSRTPAPNPIYIDEPTLPVGVVKRIDTAHGGAKVSFTRKVFFFNGDLKEEKTFWSNYVPWPAVYQRGTKPIN